MYESYYGFTEKPFSIQPDPDFLFLGRLHSMAYAVLEYGVENRAGFTVITGGIGSGKTTLIRCLLGNMPDNVTVGLMTNTHRKITEILEWVMLAFGQPFEGMSHTALYAEFVKFISSEYKAGRRVILIVDEAQNLSTDVLEELRLISNVNADKQQLLQLILVGQPELKELLSTPELRQFAQRVAVDFHLSPLTAKEVELYVWHRLRVAGRRDQLFTRGALQDIASLSNGIPRSINILCDTALVYGMSVDAEIIDQELIQEVIRDKAEFGVFSKESDMGPG